jgi:hypothetical protein
MILTPQNKLLVMGQIILWSLTHLELESATCQLLQKFLVKLPVKSPKALTTANCIHLQHAYPPHGTRFWLSHAYPRSSGAGIGQCLVLKQLNVITVLDKCFLVNTFL